MERALTALSVAPLHVHFDVADPARLGRPFRAVVRPALDAAEMARAAGEIGAGGAVDRFQPGIGCAHPHPFGKRRRALKLEAFGAGLLSSYSELEHAFSTEVERRPFDLEEVIRTPYDYSDMQPLLFVIPSYAYLKDVTAEFIRRFGKHHDWEVAPAGVPKAVW